MEALIFYVFGALALISAIAVVVQRSPIGSAFALILTLCSLSAIFGLLGSPFIAVLQIAVYAGAIMVLFIFVLMLLNVRREEEWAGTRKAVWMVAIVLGLFFVLQMGAVLSRQDLRPAAAPADHSTLAMAHVLFSTQYLYAFEATSVLILAALVGAIVLARKEPS